MEKSEFLKEISRLDREQIRDLCQYKSRFTGKRWLDQFDYVTFLNDK